MNNIKITSSCLFSHVKWMLAYSHDSFSIKEHVEITLI